MKGIMFNPDMIQAIVEGRKTQTRRLSGLKEINKEPDKWKLWPGQEPNGKFITFFDGHNYDETKQPLVFVTPRYQPGETVYIKEALRKDGRLGDCTYDDEQMTPVLFEGRTIKWDWKGYKRSPLFMPEWAARHFVKFKSVEAQRLQEITDGDAEAEGFRLMVGTTAGGGMGLASPRYSFSKTWDTINPKYPWETNPWVFKYVINKVKL